MFDYTKYTLEELQERYTTTIKAKELLRKRIAQSNTPNFNDVCRYDEYSDIAYCIKNQIKLLKNKEKTEII